jgi:hypothetical protein
MKHLTKFPVLLIFMAMPLLFISCNGDEKKSEPETPAAENTSAPAVKVNTIVTTPQLMALIKHKIKDYASWKSVYDAHDSARLANGLHSYVIGRSMQDSMEIMVALKADNLDKAKAFTKDPTVKEQMKKAGVMSTPEISLINIMWQDTVDVGNIPRVISTYAVKDWDTWKTVFEEGKQERIDNGIVDRQYGHDADDNHKISLVTAITDTAKARAYWTSDALKKRREAGGLTSEPKRFVFNIVQRYR